MRFTIRKKIKLEAALPARNVLAAVPVIPADVDAGVDNAQLVQLRRQVVPRGLFSRLVGRVANIKYDVRINLDKYGSFFWQQIDARRNLGDIAALLAVQFAWPEEKAKDAVLMFTRTLVERNLLGLKLEAE